MNDPTHSYHLEYLLCGEYTTNNKILDLLEDLATKNVKCSLSIHLEKYSDNYYSLYLDVLKTFKIKDHGGIEASPYIKSWSSIRRKVQKDLILKKFIIDIKTKYHFDEDLTEKLRKDLVTGLNFKNINDKNIHIDGNKIVNIDGLFLAQNYYEWKFDIKVYNDPKKKSIVSK